MLNTPEPHIMCRNLVRLWISVGFILAAWKSWRQPSKKVNPKLMSQLYMILTSVTQNQTGKSRRFQQQYCMVHLEKQVSLNFTNCLWPMHLKVHFLTCIPKSNWKFPFLVLNTYGDQVKNKWLNHKMRSFVCEIGHRKQKWVFYVHRQNKLSQIHNI